jgi:hypothetical protein
LEKMGFSLQHGSIHGLINKQITKHLPASL